ncbi:hypothetical protein QZH41_011773 [Actinostola sp. cb2023]|nr:hypothetical protein QZH41_011773 [Actinostola sp. cb2023]
MAALMSIKVELDDEYTKDKRRNKILDKMWWYVNLSKSVPNVMYPGFPPSVTANCYNQTYRMGMLGYDGNKTVDMSSVDDKSTSLWYILDEFGSKIQHSDEPTCRTALFYYVPMQLSYTLMWPSRDLEYGDYKEILPEGIPSPQREPQNGVYKVYTTCNQVKTFLTDSRSLEKNGQMINQLPFDYLLTCKDQLAEVCQRSGLKHEEFESFENDELLCRGPYWLPVTFNLNKELPEFIQHFKRREKRGLDNHWIVKPWNMGRGLDLHVTKNLNHLIRMAETGPKVG